MNSRLYKRLSDFTGVTAITFHNNSGKDKRVKVTKPGDVKRLIAAIKLTPKKPCKCLHNWSAIFLKKGKVTKVAICNHCFNIQGDRPAKYFKMSPEFFRLFAKHTGWVKKKEGQAAPTTSNSRRSQSEAEADLRAGRARYFHVGQPLSTDSQLADILMKHYGLALVGFGCSPVPPVGEHAKGCNERVPRSLSQQFALIPGILSYRHSPCDTHGG